MEAAKSLETLVPLHDLVITTKSDVIPLNVEPRGCLKGTLLSMLILAEGSARAHDITKFVGLQKAFQHQQAGETSCVPFSPNLFYKQARLPKAGGMWTKDMSSTLPAGAGEQDRLGQKAVLRPRHRLRGSHRIASG